MQYVCVKQAFNLNILCVFLSILSPVMVPEETNILPYGHSGTHVGLQVGAPHPAPPRATEPEHGPLRLLLQPVSQAAARSAAP